MGKFYTLLQIKGLYVIILQGYILGNGYNFDLFRV